MNNLLNILHWVFNIAIIIVNIILLILYISGTIYIIWNKKVNIINLISFIIGIGINIMSIIILFMYIIPSKDTLFYEYHITTILICNSYLIKKFIK